LTDDRQEPSASESPESLLTGKSVSRREFLKIAGVAGAAVGVGAREPNATRLAAMAKRLATDTGFEVVNGALQLHGGYGYLRDHPIERVLRDVRVHQILEGTNEIMRVIVSRDMLGN